MEELRQLNASLKATGIVPVVDLVLNHRVRADIKEWMAWLQHEMGFQGFRFDFVRGKFCTVTYGPRKQSLKLQTPAVYMPFGLSSFRDEATGLVTDSVEVSLRGWDDPSNSSMQQLYNVLQQIDEAVLQSAEQQSQELFGKPMGRGILQEFQRQLLKRRDEKFPPLWKSKAGVNMQGQLPRVYDVQDKTQAQELGYITKGTTAKLLVTMPSMYLISKSYGLSCRLVQVLVTHRPMQDEGCQLRDDDDDCNSHDDSTTTTTTAAIMVEEDDGDSDF
ncbi:hypothetical protein OEZ85_009287 [Tetradesmus obliquus]|uniref:Glycosyl hydrolase family 13 catalytic domain-containing protein n=1 Tax=Tetradesmus obliquus TaxID=3088 RepID=A0ABY8U8T6_TETOB|nr:hypothetical protein OEZ85_009287 [Tetradesmus obliquus]